MTQRADLLKVQAGAVVDSEARTLLKTFRHGTAPVSVLVSFAAVQERPQRTGPGLSSRSQTAPTCRERTSTDLESVLGRCLRSLIALILTNLGQREWRGCTMTIVRAYAGVTDDDWYRFLATD